MLRTWSSSSAVAPELDELAGFQHPQLVADRALRDAHDLGNIVDAKLAFKQSIQNFDAGRVPEHPEQLGQVIQDLIPRQIVLQPGDVGLVQGLVLHFLLRTVSHWVSHPFICLYVHMLAS